LPSAFSSYSFSANQPFSFVLCFQWLIHATIRCIHNNGALCRAQLASGRLQAFFLSFFESDYCQCGNCYQTKPREEAPRAKKEKPSSKKKGRPDAPASPVLTDLLLPERYDRQSGHCRHAKCDQRSAQA